MKKNVDTGKIRPATSGWLFHKPSVHSTRRDWARYGLLTFSRLFARGFASVVPGKERRLAWTELVFKIRAFALFEHINIFLNLAYPLGQSLEKMLNMVQTMEPEKRVWAAEGVGYLFSENGFKQNESPVRLFHNQNLRSQSWSLFPLHSGLGMSMAGRFFEDLKNKHFSSKSFKEIEHYLSLAGENCFPGYSEIPIESLGFTARLLYPREIPVIDKIIREIDQELVGYFWHGVGRALCFLPSNMWPGRNFPWRAVDMAVKEAPHEVGRLNVFSGLAWPLTLVNLSEPKLMEGVIKYHRDRLSENDAFSSGVGSAIVMLRESIGDSPLIHSLYEHQPTKTEPGLVDAYNRIISTPCKRALTDLYPSLKKSNRWSELFIFKMAQGIV